MDKDQKSTTKILQVGVKILTQPVRLSSPCLVEVQVTNKSAQPVLLNKRLSVGYRDSQSRELYFEIFGKGSTEDVGKRKLLYERPFASPEDYVWVEPEQSVAANFDLFEWYSLPSIGEYELVAYYQGDEKLAPKPTGLLTGTYCSERIALTVVP